MAKDLKVGDRCAIYDSCERRVVVVQGVSGYGLFLIRERDGAQYHAHGKQLRKLKPKQKRVPRECWLRYFEGKNDPWGCAYHSEESAKDPDFPPCREVIHMREVLEDAPKRDKDKE